MNASVPVRAASTVMLIREAAQLEVLMVRRHHKIDFMSGAMVFPGGKIEEADGDPGWADYARGWDSVPETERAPRVAAVREAFEESGVVIGAEDSAASHAEMIETRKAIDAGTLPFLDFIREQKITIDIGRLTLFSRWRTPPISPKRFDTFFFLAPVPTDQIAIHDGHEAVESEWVAPQEALRLAEAGQRTIVFPTRMNLRLLSSSPTLADAVAAADRRERITVEPRIITRDDKRYLQLDPEHGYGTVEEPLQI